MFTKKGYLVSIGELPPGSENKRGRLSLAHDNLCKEAVANGVQIQGYSVATTVSTPAKPSEKVVEKSAAPGEKQVIEPAPLLHPENLYRAFERTDKGRVYRSMREACRHCRLSLVGCPCEAPEIVALDATKSVRVYIEAKPQEGDN